MMEKIAASFRRALLALISDAGLFAFIAFVFASFQSSGLLKWYQEPIGMLSSYVLTPWGVALILVRLMRAQEKKLFSADTTVLVLLIMWIIVPFALRFGVTFNNMSSWNGYSVVFLGIYALLREEDPARRARELDRVCALCAALSLVLGGALLYCAATVQVFGLELDANGFGVNLGSLCAGQHYNTTGMIAVTLLMLCLTGAARRRHVLAKAAHLIPAALMAAVVVLTQSRTARISMLLGLAVCVYGALAVRIRGSVLVRHGAGIACAAAVLLAGYFCASALTQAAVAHYNGETVFTVREDGRETVQTAEEEPDAQAAPEDAQTVPETEDASTAPSPQPTAAAEEEHYEVRLEADASFSDRTTIWRNLFALWRENPRHMLIGNGVGRTGSRIVAGTIHESNGAVAVHNTYLQFIADFGLIGFGLLIVFFVIILRPVLRAFYNARGGRFAGAHALSALVIASLATGMMESAPLGAMTPMNIMLYLALAVLAGEGRLVKRDRDMV